MSGRTNNNDSVEVDVIMRAFDREVVDAVWEAVRALLPVRDRSHPLGCCRPRISDCGGEGTGKNPVDRGKLGWKWSIAAERRGIPVGWAIGGANRNDSLLLEPALAAVADTGLLDHLHAIHRTCHALSIETERGEGRTALSSDG